MTNSMAFEGYELKVVTFLDVLGFRHIVENERASKIRQMLSMLRRTTASNTEFRDEPDVQHYFFSDSIVRVREIRDTLAETFALEANDLALAQVDLLHSDVLIRGGMTAGYIYADSQSVFGPAMVRAYDIESQQAVFPRIVVDKSLEPYLAINSPFADPFFSQIFRKDARHTWVDYLSVAYAELDEDADMFELLWKHKGACEDGMQKWLDNNRVQKKFRWLSHYHNAFCMSRYSPDDAAGLIIQAFPKRANDWLFDRHVSAWSQRFSDRRSWGRRYNFSDEHESETFSE